MRMYRDESEPVIRQAFPGTGNATHVVQPDAGSLLHPGIFAHGRLLRRFRGSDASRFSSRSALNILRHMDTGAESGPHILWDPFCGTGLIPCVALFACARKFDAVIASDINPEAVHCAEANMRLFYDVRAFDERLREVRVRQNANRKERRRWGEVAKYMEEIRPVVESRRGRLPLVHAFACSALALPWGVRGRVHFVADLPYGNMCILQGGVLQEVIAAILRVYPEAGIAFVLPREAMEDLHVDGVRGLRWRGLKNGRVILRV